MPAPTAAARHRYRLAGAMLVSIGVLAIELVAGIAGNSLALMADAGHVFADVSGMAVSLGAVWLANRPTTSVRSFGLYRLEIIAAVANAYYSWACRCSCCGRACGASSHRPPWTRAWLSSLLRSPSPQISSRSHFYVEAIKKA